MVKIKIDRERRDPIEVCTQIGQRPERFDSPDDTRDTKKIEQLGEKRYAAHVEAKDRMTKSFQNEQEKSASAAEIEHALRRRAMQLQILHAFAIQAQPGIHVRVFGVPGGQAGVALLYFAQTLAIDACPQPPKRQAKNGALRSAPCAPVRQGMCKLADLTVKLHLRDCVDGPLSGAGRAEWFDTRLSILQDSFHDFAKKSRATINVARVNLKKLRARFEFLARGFCI